MIKTELRGGGSSFIVRVTTNNGAKVTLRKDNKKLSQIATDGVVEFKEVDSGKWNIITEYNGGSISKELIVSNEFNEYLPIGIFLKDLPFMSKVLIEDTAFYVIGQNHEGYPDNSTTLWQQYVWENVPFDQEKPVEAPWDVSTIRKYCNETWLDKFSERFKNKVLVTNLKNRMGESTNDKVFLLGVSEVGLSDDDIDGSNLGFTTNQERIAYHLISTSKALTYWTRSGFARTQVYTVGVNGNIVTSDYVDANTITLRPALNLPNDLIFSKEPNYDGYYEILEGQL